MPQPKNILTHPLFWIVLIAGVLRLGMAVYKPPDPQNWSDAGTYHNLAVNMLAGNGVSEDGHNPSRIRTPGYSAFLAIIYLVFGESPRIAVIVQTLICTVIVYLAFRLAEIVFDRRAAYLAALIAAGYPALIYYGSRLLREGITGLFLTLMALLVFRHAGRSERKHQVVLGVLLAIVSMIRPETLIMGLPATYLLIKPGLKLRRFWRPIVLISLPIALVWVPWTIRNYIYFGSVSPITVGIGATMWFGNRWSAIGGDDHKESDLRKLKKETLEIKDESMATGHEANVERTFDSLVLKDLKQRPGWFLAMIGNKMVLFWKDANGVKKTLPAISPWLADALNIFYYLMLILMVLGIGLQYKQPRVRALAGWVVTYMMVYALLHVRNRYRVPVLPIVIVLSSGGFWALWDALKSRLPVQSPRERVAIAAPGETPREQVSL